jgi:hypothetical protein
MLFREIIAIYYENHMKHTNTLRERSAQFSMLRQEYE